jgi:hypothetical protein
VVTLPTKGEVVGFTSGFLVTVLVVEVETEVLVGVTGVLTVFSLLLLPKPHPEANKTTSVKSGNVFFI